MSRQRKSHLELNVIDLFCGAGGLSEGFENAGFDVTYALDNEFDACDTYRRNHPSTKIDQVSITDRTPRAIARAAGDADVIVGGPSCQGFSTHGRRDPKDERNKLWRHMRYIVKEIKPKAFLLENVPGLVHHKDGRVGGEIIRLFSKLGYTVDTQILLAANYGVPQLRRRVFLVGVLKGYHFEFPEPTHWAGWRRDHLEKCERERQARGLLSPITSWEAIVDLPRLGETTGAPEFRYTRRSVSPYAELMRKDSQVIRDHEVVPLSDTYADLIPYIPPGGTWRDVPPYLLPDRYRGMRRTDGTNLLGRLDPNRPAYTITTQYNNVTGGCFTHPREDRSLSVREGARLQSFPDRYEFVGSITSKCRQIGNAVPPLLAQHLACAIAESLAEGTLPRRPVRIKSVRTPLPPNPPSDATRKRMVGQARRDTLAEVLLRKELFRRGLRFRISRRPIPDLRREADLVFTGPKVAVFVDGCFWHGCPKHTRPTKSNTKWWRSKIDANRARDEETNRLLKADGWRVVRVWEHETPDKAADRVERAVLERLRRRPQR